MQVLIFVVGMAFAFVATLASVTESREALLWAWSTFAVVVALFAWDFRRDAFRAAPFALMYGLGTATIAGAVVRYSEGTHLNGAALCAVGLVTAVAAGRILWRTQRAPEPLGNPLKTHAIGPLYEVDGVQLAVGPQLQSVRPGAGVSVRIVVQNCWDTPRRVQVSLRRAGGVLGARGEVLWQNPELLSLPEAGAMALELPVVAVPKAKGLFTLLVSVDVGAADRPGVRIRLRRVATLQRSGSGLRGVFVAMAQARGANTLSASIRVKGRAVDTPVEAEASPEWTVLASPSHVDIGVAKRSLEAAGYVLS